MKGWIWSVFFNLKYLEPDLASLNAKGLIITILINPWSMKNTMLQKKVKAKWYKNWFLGFEICVSMCMEEAFDRQR